MAKMVADGGKGLPVTIERILSDGLFAGGYRAVCDLVDAFGEGFSEDEALDALMGKLAKRDGQRRSAPDFH